MTRSARLGLLALLLASAVGCAALERAGQSWWELRRDSSGQAPDPAEGREAVVQVYAARAVSWRGLLGVHTWVAVKPSGADAYTRYEVIGWGVDQGAPAVRINRAGPDNYWFGSRPDLLVDRRGEGVDALITKVEASVAAYPYQYQYRTWPGPNSNTFTAYIGRAAPELRLQLPPTAIGKDYLPRGVPGALTPSGTGVQLSLFGLAGVLAGWDEGLELSVLGLSFGLDVIHPALKLPIAGRLGMPPQPTIRTVSPLTSGRSCLWQLGRPSARTASRTVSPLTSGRLCLRQLGRPSARTASPEETEDQKENP